MGSKTSKSTSTAQTTTANTDRRQVIAEGAIGLAGDSISYADNSVTNALDATIVTSALDVVKANDATNGQSFSALLNMADKMFSSAGDIIGKAQDTTMAQISAINTAKNDTTGQIDQKTIVILAGAALGLLALRKR